MKDFLYFLLLIIIAIWISILAYNQQIINKNISLISQQLDCDLNTECGK